MCPRGSSSAGRASRGERRSARLVPLLIVSASLLISLAPGIRAWAQTPSSEPAPSGGGASEPSQPSAPPPAGPAAPVFVPPLPPPPSQSRLPGAFQQPFLQPPSAVYEFHPSFTLTEEYTDNFTLAEHGRTENFRTSLGAGGTFLINRPLTQGIVTGNLSVSLDSATGSSEYHIFPTLTASVRHTFTPRMSLTLTDSFQRSDEASQGDVGGLRRERATFVSNTFGASVDWLLDLVATQSYYRNSLFLGTTDTVSHILGVNASVPLGTLMSVRGGYEFTRRETSRSSGTFNTGESTTDQSTINPDVGDTTTIGHRVLGSLSRQVGQWTTVGLSSSYSWETADRGTEEDDESRSWNVSLFTAYGTPAGLSISSSVGVSVFDSDRSGGQRVAFTTNTTASYRWAFATATVGVSQDVRQTGDEGQNFGTVITRSLLGSFSYQFTPFVTARARANYSRNEPTGSGNDLGAQASSTFTMGAGATWAILRWLRMNLDYTYTQRSTDNDRSLSSGGDRSRGNAPETDSTENRAVLTLSATF